MPTKLPASLLVALGLALAPLAAAQTRDSGLVEGIDLYWKADYDGAIERLGAIDVSTLETGAQIVVHKFLGLSHLARRQEDEARAAFREILLLDPAYQLSAAEFSPQVLGAFDAVKDVLAEADAAGGMAAFEAGDYERAVALFERALSLDPGRPVVVDLLPIARDRRPEEEPEQEVPPCRPARVWSGLSPDGGDCRPVNVSKALSLPVEANQIELVYDRHHYGVGRCWRLVLYGQDGRVVHAFEDPTGAFADKDPPPPELRWQIVDLPATTTVTKAELYADHRHGGKEFLARRVGATVEDHFILSLNVVCDRAD